MTYDDEVESSPTISSTARWPSTAGGYGIRRTAAQLTISGIKADELYVRQFIADLVRVDLGEGMGKAGASSPKRSRRRR